jgi:DNA-binding NtrC family response regulator
VEKELIARAMRRARGNKSKAAKLLGLTRPRLYRRLVQLGLEHPDQHGAEPKTN